MPGSDRPGAGRYWLCDRDRDCDWLADWIGFITSVRSAIDLLGEGGLQNRIREYLYRWMPFLAFLAFAYDAYAHAYYVASKAALRMHIYVCSGNPAPPPQLSMTTHL